MSAWRRGLKRTAHKKKPKDPVFLEHHRVPPKPPYYYDQEKGQCRYCGNVIKNDNGKTNMRANWHPECADEYKIIYIPTETRKYLWKRDGGYCASCGDVMPKKSRHHDLRWHVDHIKPLWEQKGKRFKEIDLDYWREHNLQTLCSECHASKTADEATLRAKLNKE